MRAAPLTTPRDGRQRFVLGRMADWKRKTLSKQYTSAFPVGWNKGSCSRLSFGASIAFLWVHIYKGGKKHSNHATGAIQYVVSLPGEGRDVIGQPRRSVRAFLTNPAVHAEDKRKAGSLRKAVLRWKNRAGDPAEPENGFFLVAGMDRGLDQPLRPARRQAPENKKPGQLFA